MYKNIIKIKRSGDQRIGKLILFAGVIIIAIGVVGLVGFFYAQSRENALLKAVLASTSSKGIEIKKIPGLENCSDTTSISHNVLADIYTLENNGNILCNLSAIQSQGIEILSPTTYKIK